jgi:hypothetical protein
VKLVFQLDRVSNPQCKEITFTLNEKFPFSLDPGVNPTSTIQGGTYSAVDYKTHWMIPYKVRVSKDALEGENQIPVQYTFTTASGNDLVRKADFNVTIENVMTDFEVSVKDYVQADNKIVFEILNVGEHNAEAVTIDIPTQATMQVKGSERNIIGSLDSNEDTTFDYEAIPSDGPIQIKIIYTDEIKQRRELTKTVNFDSSYFSNRKRDEVAPTPTWIWVVLALIVILIIWIIYRRIARNRRKHHN